MFQLDDEPNQYMKNRWFTKHPSIKKNWCFKSLGGQVKGMFFLKKLERHDDFLEVQDTGWNWLYVGL